MHAHVQTQQKMKLKIDAIMMASIICKEGKGGKGGGNEGGGRRGGGSTGSVELENKFSKIVAFTCFRLIVMLK